MKNIFLITLSFPYYKGGENTFLQHEIEHLCRVFDKVTILPANTEGEKQNLKCKPIIDDRLAQYLMDNKVGKLQKIKSFISPIFWTEIQTNPKTIFSFRKLKKIIGHITFALLIKKWFSNYLLINNLVSEKFIVYTYWCTNITHGIGLCKTNANFKLINRAHGLDLYEERGAVVCRAQLLKLVDGFYLVSSNGFEYMKSKYSKYSNIFHLNPLGIKSLGSISKSSKSGKFVVVSCSTIDENKRVSLIFDSLKKLAEKLTDIAIYWHHFGDGILKKELENAIYSLNLNNLHCKLHGFVKNEIIMSFYQNNSVDLFISTTQSEGGRPVSMQEALSCGIPLMGTAVGGIPEIIHKEIGVLLNENATASEIAEIFLYLIENPTILGEMRMNTVKHWNEKFNADVNYASFVNHLINNYHS